jgi:Peptidase_C39 like family
MGKIGKAIARSLVLAPLIIFSPCFQLHLFAADSTPPTQPQNIRLNESSCPQSKSLPIPLEQQQTSAWCWSAAAKMAMSYKGTPHEQCFIVDGVRQNQLGIKSPSTCCIAQPQIVSGCGDVLSFSWRALKEFNFTYDRVDESRFGWDKLRTQVCGDGPIIYAEDYWTGGGHEYILKGFREASDGKRWVVIYDPLDDPTDPLKSFQEESFDEWLRLPTTGPDPYRSGVEYLVNIHK